MEMTGGFVGILKPWLGGVSNCLMQKLPLLVLEILVIVLFIAALWQVGSADTKPRAGDVFAVFSYLWRFVESLDQVPVLIQKSAKLRDLDRRLASAAD
jgi:ABC-type multidrug transport system fused ATPase/permease subunit